MINPGEQTPTAVARLTVDGTVDYATQAYNLKAEKLFGKEFTNARDWSYLDHNPGTAFLSPA